MPAFSIASPSVSRLLRRPPLDLRTSTHVKAIKNMMAILIFIIIFYCKFFGQNDELPQFTLSSWIPIFGRIFDHVKAIKEDMALLTSAAHFIIMLFLIFSCFIVVVCQSHQYNNHPRTNTDHHYLLYHIRESVGVRWASKWSKCLYNITLNTRENVDHSCFMKESS